MVLLFQFLSVFGDGNVNKYIIVQVTLLCAHTKCNNYCNLYTLIHPSQPLHSPTHKALIHMQAFTPRNIHNVVRSVPGADNSTPPVPADGTLRYPVPQPVFVDEGTWPKGSTWARDPLPRRQDSLTGLHNASSCPGPNAR